MALHPRGDGLQLRLHKGDRNGLLLVVLLAVLVFSPYLEKGAITRVVFNIMLSLVMVSGALAAAQTHGRIKLVGVGLAALLLGSFLLAHSQHPAAIPLIRLAEILFLSVVGASVLGKVLAGGAVTLDKILGAVSVYILAGLVLGLTALLMEGLAPGSFRGPDGTGSLDGADMVYFGYVTLTTLGYGDIVPVSAKARSLALLGAIIGPLYMAILIARLVSGYGGDDIRELVSDPGSGE